MRQYRDNDLLWLGPAQRTGRLVRGGAGREDVIDQKHRLPGQIKSAADGECVVDVAAALCGSLPSLRGGAVSAAQPRGTRRNAELMREGAGQDLALIETAAPTARPMQRNRDENTRMQIAELFLRMASP